MPGISIAGWTNGADPFHDLSRTVRKGMLHFQNYGDQEILADKNINIGFTAYGSYPRQIIHTAEYMIAMEGLIYNYDKIALAEKLKEIAVNSTGSTEMFSVECKNFLLNADGEFVLLIYDKLGKRVMIANDVLGRLPLYYHRQQNLFVVSRELKFILPFLPSMKINMSGMVEYLLFGYPFEENTFFEDVHFLPGSHSLRFNTMTDEFNSTQYHLLNFENSTEKVSRPKVISNLRKYFLLGLKNRIEGTKKTNMIVSLSGGLDSRGTLAGIKRLGYAPTAVTAASDEENWALRVANSMKTEIHSMAQNVPIPDFSFSKAVFLKDGLDCHPDLIQLHLNLCGLREHFGENAIYYTGIYGGEITRHLHLTGGLTSLDALAEYLLNAKDRCKYCTQKVSAIFQWSSKKIKDRISERLSAFPEKDIYKKYLRFRHECNMRFTGEAEDRNRYYFWTISPYFSLPFFNFIMSVDENRKNVRLFRDFLFSIDPETCRIPYYDFKISLSRFPLYILGLFERMARHARFKKGIRRLISIARAFTSSILFMKNPEIAKIKIIKQELLALLRESTAVRKYLDLSAVKSIVQSENDMQGLERLKIVIVSLDCSEKWRDRFTPNFQGPEGMVTQVSNSLMSI